MQLHTKHAIFLLNMSKEDSLLLAFTKNIGQVDTSESLKKNECLTIFCSSWFCDFYMSFTNFIKGNYEAFKTQLSESHSFSLNNDVNV